MTSLRDCGWSQHAAASRTKFLELVAWKFSGTEFHKLVYTLEKVASNGSLLFWSSVSCRWVKVRFVKIDSCTVLFSNSAVVSTAFIIMYKVKKVKCSRYRPVVVQRVGRGIALLFHDRGTRSGWVVSSTPRPHFTPGEDPVPIVQETGWAPGSVWTCGKSRPHRGMIPDRPARSQSL